MSPEKRQLVEELHAPARRNFLRRRVIVHGFDDLWQADIVDMQSYTQVNNGYRYILTIIDVFSKFAWALPLKTKNGKDVTQAFSKSLKNGRKPKHLQTDEGKEFYNVNFQSFIKRNNINHYSTYSVMKPSVVERFNGTLKNSMWKKFTLNGHYKWINILSELVNDHNHHKHRTIGMRPIDVTSNNSGKLLSTVYNHIKIAGPAKFKVGDHVRISKHKSVFAKGYTPNWSTEVFTIAQVRATNPVTYLMKDYSGCSISGGFYEYELHAVKNPDVFLVEKVLRKKGNKVYVKWLGFHSSHNSWIDKKDSL